MTAANAAIINLKVFQRHLTVQSLTQLLANTKIALSFYFYSQSDNNNSKIVFSYYYYNRYF